MGPREKALREDAARCFPPDGEAYFKDSFSLIGLERRQLLDALEEALDGWAGATVIRGGAEDIARLRKLLEEE